MGFSPMGTNGFGKTLVNGSSRVPLPPARITACTAYLLSCHDHSVNVWVLYQHTRSLRDSKVLCNPCSNMYCGSKPSSVSAVVATLASPTLLLDVLIISTHNLWF